MNYKIYGQQNLWLEESLRCQESGSLMHYSQLNLNSMQIVWSLVYETKRVVNSLAVQQLGLSIFTVAVAQGSVPS